MTLSACATARMHSAAELNRVASGCGLALGQLIQDEEARKVVIVMEEAPSIQQQACVGRWAKKNHMRPVFIDAIDWAED